MSPPVCDRLSGMSTFVLIPGAGSDPWFWHRVVPLLEQAGHHAIAVDLPADDEAAGLPEYRDLTLAAMRGHGDVVVVAQSLGGFTAPLVASDPSVQAVVLVNAMIPRPGETPGEWWDATGSDGARVAAAEANGYPVEFDVDTYFLHDVPSDLAAASLEHVRPEADAVFTSVCAFERWPAVPITVIAGRDDRFFPVEFQQRLARERLGIEADVLPGGHLLPLSHPEPLAKRLTSNR
jgi:pimeloyl-ACP methyl ester carboxylesterase